LELGNGLSHTRDYGAFFTAALALASLFRAILGQNFKKDAVGKI
jgi:hypothetical protein